MLFLCRGTSTEQADNISDGFIILKSVCATVKLFITADLDLVMRECNVLAELIKLHKDRSAGSFARTERALGVLAQRVYGIAKRTAESMDRPGQWDTEDGDAIIFVLGDVMEMMSSKFRGMTLPGLDDEEDSQGMDYLIKS